jgi:hypothetical protein
MWAWRPVECSGRMASKVRAKAQKCLFFFFWGRGCGLRREFFFCWGFRPTEDLGWGRRGRLWNFFFPCWILLTVCWGHFFEIGREQKHIRFAKKVEFSGVIISLNTGSFSTKKKDGWTVWVTGRRYVDDLFWINAYTRQTRTANFGFQNAKKKILLVKIESSRATRSCCNFFAKVL